MSGSIATNHVISHIILSIFELEGPTPVYCLPNTLDYDNQLVIAMKSISLLMGEQVYQEGKDFDSLKYFGILPFPDLKLTGLTYFFLIKDVTARGSAKASTICILADDIYSSFLYEQMKDLSVIIAESADLIKHNSSKDEMQEIIQTLMEKVNRFSITVANPASFERKIKILFTGLDASGKTSFLRAIKQRYSELIGIKPTKGIERVEESILGRALMEWDIGGQLKYRSNFLKQADLYLYDTNLLFFLVDVRDENRYSEALAFFGQIIQIFESFNQYPPIIINLHKIDPDITDSDPLRPKIQALQNQFLQIGQKFKIRFYQTSIFNPYSLVKSFSEGIQLMSPNRDILRGQLKWLASELEAQALLLMNDNSIILSDFAVDELTERVSEISAPHFQNLFRTFTHFNMMKQNNAVLSMDESIFIFIKIGLVEFGVYLLCMIKNRTDLMTQFHALMPEFQQRIQDLIKTYI